MSVFKISVEGNNVFIVYTPEENSDWLKEKTQNSETPHLLKKTFRVSKGILDEGRFVYQMGNISENNDDYYDTYYFIIGRRESSESDYKFDKEILNINYNLFISADIELKINYFYKTGISVFHTIGEVFNGESLYIKSDERLTSEDENCEIPENELPFSQFKYFLKNIPNKTELDHYKHSRYTSVLKNYITVDDAERKHEIYVNRKLKLELKSSETNAFSEYETLKYEFVLNKMRGLLDKKHLNNYISTPEKEWQEEILKVFRLIYPKYVYIGEKLNLKSFKDCSRLETDITITDFEGNIDLIEIKKPSPDIFYKSKYRKNYYPVREITGTCMQLQNYLISLQKTKTEDLNSAPNKDHLQVPNNFDVKAITPKGIIIYGLEEQLTTEEAKSDFQILKNMYANIIDFITYDDLIRRLERIITAMKISKE
jgi:hypothetical protein